MNKEKIAQYLFLSSLVFAAGVFTGESHRGKGTFFVSWYGDDLYYGEHVKIKDKFLESDHYNKDCKKRTIRGLQALTNANAAWVLLENCSWSNEPLYLETLDQNALEKE